MVHSVRKWLNMPLPSLRESLEEAIEEYDFEHDQAMGNEEKALLRNVLEFRELTVENIMVPRADMVMVPSDIELEELHQTIVKETHTRIPVFRKTPDDILGYVHTKDLVSLLCNKGEFNIKEMLHEAMFVPPSMRILDLLLHMRARKVHMAIVVDEYGGTSGLVTMEDIMEEIVGEIEDEHDTTKPEVMFSIVSGYVFDVSARMSVMDLEKELGTHLAEEDSEYDTVGGMIFDMLGRIPTVGEVVSHPQGFEFEITEGDARRIRRITVRQLETQPKSE